MLFSFRNIHSFCSRFHNPSFGIRSSKRQLPLNFPVRIQKLKTYFVIVLRCQFSFKYSEFFSFERWGVTSPIWRLHASFKVLWDVLFKLWMERVFVDYFKRIFMKKNFDGNFFPLNCKPAKNECATELKDST